MGIQLLRYCKSRVWSLQLRRLFGPPGFLRQVEAKLAAYTWNLVENYDTDFTLEVTEILTETDARRIFPRSASGVLR